MYFLTLLEVIGFIIVLFVGWMAINPYNSDGKKINWKLLAVATLIFVFIAFNPFTNAPQDHSYQDDEKALTE